MLHELRSNQLIGFAPEAPGLNFPFPGAIVDILFPQQLAWRDPDFVNIADLLTCTRAQTVPSYAERLDGSLQSFAPDELRITDKGLLVEESRENIVTYSEDIGNWTITNGVRSLNAEIAPNGEQTADRLSDNNDNLVGQLRCDRSVANMALSTTHTLAVCVKYISGSGWIQLHCANMGALNLAYSYFDIKNGVLGTLGAHATGHKIEELANGWYRCSVVFASDAADASVTFRLLMTDGDMNVNLTRNGTHANAFWAMQLEPGAFPTSYIPTTTAAVTRNADVDMFSDTSFLNASEGTIYASGVRINNNTPGYRQLWGIDGPAARMSMIDWWAGGDNFRFYVTNPGIIGSVFSQAGLGAAPVKTAARYKSNDYGAAYNGVLGSPDANLAGLPDTTQPFYVGGGNNAEWCDFIIRLACFPDGHPNADLQALTS